MAVNNLDHGDLSAALVGGVVKEDVMEKIWQLDNYRLPFTEMCSKGTHKNEKVEFTTDEFTPASETNAVVDGADIDQDDSKVGERVANYTQTSVKEVKVSTRANAVASIGRQGTLSYQIAQRQKELRRDVEAQMVSATPSLAGDANGGIAGNSAGLGAWISTNAVGGAGFAAGGFNTASGIIEAPTFGTPQAISEAALKDIMLAIYMEGGEGMYLMARPEVIKLISEFYFTGDAKAAAMLNDNATGTDKMTAYSATKTIVTDFGVLNLLPNRIQGVTGAGASTAYILDPKYLKQSMLTGYRTEGLAKTGLSEKRMMSVDYSLLVTNEKSQGAIFDVSHTDPMVA